MYYTKEEVLDLFKETSDNKSQYDDNKDKYTLVDIDNDGIEDLLFYDAISATNYDLWVFKGSNDGFYLTTKLLTNAHYQNTGIKKEADKDYFIIYTAHMGNENIKYIFIKENGYEEINVLDHEMNPETSDYEIEKIKDSLEWVEIK